MRTHRIILLSLVATLPAAAGPSSAERLRPVALVADHGGAWVVGADLCDNSEVAVWYGTGARPAVRPRIPHVEDAVLASIPRPQRAAIRSTSTVGATTYAVGRHGTIVVTTNGGKAWSVQRSTASEDLIAVWASSPHDAFAIGNNLVLATHDGGASWRRVDRGQNMWFAIWGAGEDIYVVGFDSLASHDRGHTWQPLATPKVGGFLGVGGTSETDVYILGRQVFHSTDRGTTWRRIEPGEDSPLLAVCRTTGPGGFGPYDCCPHRRTLLEGGQ